MARKPTQYARQRNRCSWCGHRLAMGTPDGHCRVVNGFLINGERVDAKCVCRSHHP